MSKNTITIQEELDLFEKGIVMRRAWIMPPGQWEYSVSKIGELKRDIAIRSTPRAAYNAAKRYLVAAKIAS